MKQTLPDTITFPQRKLKKNYRSITGHFPSIKNNKSVAFESKLESVFFLTLEFDNDVESYVEQPKITIFIDGTEKPYHADCYVKMKESSNRNDLIVEVKYTNEIEKKQEYYEKKFKAAHAATQELGLDFMLYTELLTSKKHLFNLDFLYRYRTVPRIERYDELILKTLEDDELPVTEITTSLSDNRLEQSKIANAVWGMVAHNILSTDLESDLDMNSIVKVFA